MNKLLSLVMLATVLLWPAPVPAQLVAAGEGYPNKPVKIIVPRPPGNANDLIARVLAQKLSDETRGQFYVENLPAGGGIVGMGAAAAAPADGHTLLAANQDLIVHPLVKAKVPYDPFKSFAPVSLLASAPEVIVVHPSVPAKDLKELIALLKAHPGKYTYAESRPRHVAAYRLRAFVQGDERAKRGARAVPRRRPSRAVDHRWPHRDPAHHAAADRAAHQGRQAPPLGDRERQAITAVSRRADARRGGFPQSSGGVLGRASAAGGRGRRQG